MRTSLALVLVAGSHLALTACGGSSNNAVAATDPGVRIQGRVVTSQGYPIQEMLVAVLGHPAVRTDVDGRFETDGVALPYAVAVFPNRATASSTVFVGLTRLNPTLEVLGTGTGIVLDAEASGTVSGGAGYPEPSNHETLVYQRLVDTAIVTGVSFGAATSATGAFGPYALSWQGPTQIDVIYRALQMKTDAVTGLPDSYTGYGTRTSQVSASDMLLSQDITLGPVGTDVIAGTATVAPGYEFNIVFVALEYSPVDPARVILDHDPATMFAYNVPVIPGTTVSVSATATSFSGFRNSLVTVPNISPGTMDIQIDCPAAPIGWFPPNGATGIEAGSVFQADDVFDRVYEFLFFGAGPQIHVVTDQPVASLPDLAAYGLSLPPMASYAWQVTTRGPFLDIDDATGPTGLRPLGTRFQTLSEGRTFTTAP